MDWVTAWSAALPVYGVSVVLHAVFPIFAVPTWIIYVIYARKVLDGARMAEDPWQGRGSPRPYLATAVLAFVVHFAAFSTLPLGGSAGAAATAAIAGFAALTTAALFLARSAPPGVRSQGGLLRVGIGAAGLAALAGPGVALGILPAEGAGALAVFVVAIALAASSFAAFEAARRRARRVSPALARKVPRA